MGSPRSTRCFRSRRSRPRSSTCVTTSPVWPTARRHCARGSSAALVTPARLTPDGHATWHRSPCIGLCERAPGSALSTCGRPGARLDAAARRSPMRSSRAFAAITVRLTPDTPSDATGRTRTAAPTDRRAASRGTAAAAAHGHRRSVQPGRLPRARRVRGAPAGAGARPRARHQRCHRFPPRRPGRRGVSDRPQVGGRRAIAGAPALPGLQRRRVGARNLQGPGADGRRPVRADRSDDDLRLRHRMRSGVHLHPRRVSVGDGAAGGGDRSGPRSRPARRQRVRRRCPVRSRC